MFNEDRSRRPRFVVPDELLRQKSHAKGEFALADFRDLIDRRPLELLLGASGIVIVVILCVAASRVRWKKIEDTAVRKSRVLRAVALAWLVVAGGLSVGLPIHAKLYPPGAPTRS